jgi:hypothetical protein
MSPEDQVALVQYSREIAKILHRNTNPDQIKTLEGIEATVREQMLEHVSPEIGIFLSKPAPKHNEDAPENSKVCLGL